MHAYETEFGKDDIWDEIVFCLGTEKSRFKRLDRVRRKMSAVISNCFIPPCFLFANPISAIYVNISLRIRYKTSAIAKSKL